MWYKHLHELTSDEWGEYRKVIKEALHGVIQESHNKGWPKAALTNVWDYFDHGFRESHGVSAVIINGEYLFLYAVGNSWWHTEPFLIEEFLLALKPGGSLAGCLSVIEDIAKAEGCGAVCIGTAAAPSNEVYARLLNRHGYKTLAYQLIKEVA